MNIDLLKENGYFIIPKLLNDNENEQSSLHE